MLLQREKMNKMAIVSIGFTRAENSHVIDEERVTEKERCLKREHCFCFLDMRKREVYRRPLGPWMPLGPSSPRRPSGPGGP